MSKDLSQKQLEEMYNGKPLDPYVMFFEKAVLDRAASELEGRRVYEKTLYVKVRAPSTTDWVAYRAQKEDLVQYAEEYQTFLSSKEGNRIVGIEIIPNMDIAHIQELIDMGYGTIPKLATATNLPDHLKSAQLSAIALNAVLQEQNHGKEESIQEDHPEERILGNHRIPEDVPTQDRRIDANDVRQPTVSGSNGGRRQDDPERLHESRREHRSQKPNVALFNDLNNFRYEFSLTRR